MNERPEGNGDCTKGAKRHGTVPFSGTKRARVRKDAQRQGTVPFSGLAPRLLCVCGLLATACFASLAFADDWPTRLHDVQRSGITSESFVFPLESEWVHKAKQPPAPAWTESPARHDYLHKWYDLKPRQHFDRCFDVAVVGSRVYFGSSTTGVVTCLDAENGGREVWSFFTGGPVRFAPHVANGKVYVGSDDGVVYCLNAADGSLIWSERAGLSDEMLWGNQQMISVWPVRGSVMVDGADVFWTAGVFPEEGMFLCKRNAVDGTGGWTTPAVAPPQGYLLALPDRLFIPTGKSFPRVYSREDGACIGQMMSDGRDGGSWALITPDRSEFWFGPNVSNESQSFNIDTGARVAMVREANCLVADSAYAYYTTDSRIIKIGRKAKSVLWGREHPGPCALIKAADALLVGGEGEVAALNAEGEVVWTHAVDGKIYGLAAANGRLYVSTDTGSIYCFRAMLPGIRQKDPPFDVTATSAKSSTVLAGPTHLILRK